MVAHHPAQASDLTYRRERIATLQTRAQVLAGKLDDQEQNQDPQPQRSYIAFVGAHREFGPIQIKLLIEVDVEFRWSAPPWQGRAFDQSCWLIDGRLETSPGTSQGG